MRLLLWIGLALAADALFALLGIRLVQRRMPGVPVYPLAVGEAVAALLLLAPRLGDRLAVLPYLVLPLICLALTLTDFPTRDPLTWSAPLVAVALGVELAQLLPAGVRRLLGEGVEVPDLAGDDADAPQAGRVVTAGR